MNLYRISELCKRSVIDSQDEINLETNNNSESYHQKRYKTKAFNL